MEHQHIHDYFEEVEPFTSEQWDQVCDFMAKRGLEFFAMERELYYYYSTPLCRDNWLARYLTADAHS